MGKKYVQKKFGKELQDETETETIKGLQKEIKQIKENRIHDREQSLAIQKQLIEGQEKLQKDISPMLSEHKEVMQTLGVLCNASKEILANIINGKYKEYMKKEYIPEDEFDEFVNLHDSYNGVKGNHSGDMKFNRCMNLPIHSDNEYDKRYTETESTE